MARILYSCCGEGQGHSSRVLTITRALTRLGHEVKVLASRKAFDVLKNRLPDVQEIPGFFFVYRNNQVEIAASLRGNLPLLLGHRRVIRQIREIIEQWQPDLAITDFEPFLPRAARQSGLRCVSLDHQGVIPYARPPLPSPQRWPAFAARTVVRATMSGEDARFATSFYYPPVPAGHNTQFFPPILREEVQHLYPQDQNYVVVYQTSSSFTRLPELLKKLPFQFKVFAYERTGVDGNLSYFPRSDAQFIDAVGGASWVLTNGGYTLMSESLYLGKPVFSIPVARQFEQWLNAWHLDDLGYGCMCDDLDEFEPAMRRFLANLDTYRENIAGQNFLGNELALARITQFLPKDGAGAAQFIAGAGEGSHQSGSVKL